VSSSSREDNEGRNEFLMVSLKEVKIDSASSVTRSMYPHSFCKDFDRAVKASWGKDLAACARR